jgi:hypothetical protein
MATGLTYGLLGWWWSRTRALLPALGVALPFLAEPLAWRLYRGFLPGPAYLWLLEIAVGLGVLIGIRSFGRLAAR